MITVLRMKKAIEKASSHEELKEVGRRLFEAELKPEKKHSLIVLYREKRRALDREYADRSENKILKRMLYRINTMPEDIVEIAKLGQSLYQSEALKTLSGFEKELIWRAFRYQKAKRLRQMAEKEEERL